MKALPASARVEIAEAVADELREIETRLAQLQLDVAACRFHRATVRLEWLRASVKTARDGLRQQAGKLRSR